MKPTKHNYKLHGRTPTTKTLRRLLRNFGTDYARWPLAYRLWLQCADAAEVDGMLTSACEEPLVRKQRDALGLDAQNKQEQPRLL